MKKVFIFSSLFLFAAPKLFAQQIKRFNPDTIMSVVIDSAVNIHSHRLNAQDFIDAVVADTSFYKAFYNMKKYGNPNGKFWIELCEDKYLVFKNEEPVEREYTDRKGYGIHMCDVILTKICRLEVIKAITEENIYTLKLQIHA